MKSFRRGQASMVNESRGGFTEQRINWGSFWLCVCVCMSECMRKSVCTYECVCMCVCAHASACVCVCMCIRAPKSSQLISQIDSFTTARGKSFSLTTLITVPLTTTLITLSALWELLQPPHLSSPNGCICKLPYFNQETNQIKIKDCPLKILERKGGWTDLGYHVVVPSIGTFRFYHACLLGDNIRIIHRDSNSMPFHKDNLTSVSDTNGGDTSVD